MNVQILLTSIAIIIATAFGIATSSIGIECYNKNEELKKDKFRNFDFIIANLVCNILMVLIAFSLMYAAFKS
jgi:hypothetical protein